MNNRTEEINHPLDLNERLDLHRKGWQVQPFGKALIVAFMIAGLLGLFGNGWLSKQNIRQGRAQVSYERFFRRDGKMELEVSMTGVSGRSAISFPLAYLKDIEITQVMPQPERSFIREGQVWYVYEADQNLQARFSLRPQTRGSIYGSVYVNEENIPIHHFIFP